MYNLLPASFLIFLLSELFIWIYEVFDVTLFDEGGAPAAKFFMKKRGDNSTDALVIRLSTKGKSRWVSIKVQNTTLIKFGDARQSLKTLR